MTSLDNLLNVAIRDAVIRNVLSLYNTSNRNSIRYYNNPPSGGYIVDEEQNYVISDHDDLSSTILLDIVSRFGSPGSDGGFSERMKEHRKTRLKKIKYRKIKENDILLTEQCPICIENFCCGEFQRTLECSHTFHKKCIDRWFKKDKDDCPMCRNKII
jgi:hypothetical protein